MKNKILPLPTLDLAECLFVLSSLLSAVTPPSSSKRSQQFNRHANSTQGWLFFLLLLSTFCRSYGQSTARYARSYGVGDNIQAMDMVVTNEGPLFAGYRRVSPGLAVLLQTDDSGHVLWSYQWGDATASLLALTNIALLNPQTVVVSGYQGSNENAYIATFRLSDRTILASNTYAGFNAFYRASETFVCKASQMQEVYCAGTDNKEETIALIKLNATLGIQWRREYGASLKTIDFQSMNLSPTGTELLLIGSSKIGGGNGYHVVMQIDTVNGNALKALRADIAGIPQGGDVTYLPDGQSFVVALSTDHLGADAADILLYQMRTDFSTIVSASMLQQPGLNTVTQLKVDSSNRILLSSYTQNHPANVNDLAGFIMLHPNRTLAWARYLSSSVHTRGMTIEFANDDNAINIGGYAQNATGGKYSVVYGKLGLDGTIQASPCLDVAIAPPVLSVLNFFTGTFSNWLSSLPQSTSTVGYLVVPSPLQPTALNLSVTTHCEQGITTPAVTGLRTTTENSIGTITVTPGVATTIRGGGDVGLTTNTPPPYNYTPVTSSTGVILTATTNSNGNPLSSPTIQQNSNPGNPTGPTNGNPDTTLSPLTSNLSITPAESMTTTSDNTLTIENGNLMPSSTLPKQQDNLLLYIIIGVLGGLLSSVVSAVAISRVFIRKRQERQNSSPENPRLATASGDDMQSARISQRYENQEESVLQSQPSAAFSGMPSSSQYDSLPPPLQHATGTLGIVNSVKKAGRIPSAPPNTPAKVKSSVKHDNNDYQAVPPPQHQEDDYAELELRSPTVAIPSAEQSGNQYTAAPKPRYVKQSSKATAVTQNGVKQNIYDVVVQQGVASQGYDDVPQGERTAQEHDDIPHPSKDNSKNHLPKNSQYDNTNVPLDTATAKLPTLTQRARTQDNEVKQDDAAKGLAADHYNKVGVFGTEGSQQRRNGHAGLPLASTNGASADVASSSNATRANYDVVPELARSVRN